MPAPYSLHTIVNVFRCVAKLIHQNPDYLKAEGVFRASGSSVATEQLIEELALNQFTVIRLQNYVIQNDIPIPARLYSALGMLPVVLKDKVLINPEAPVLLQFSTRLKDLLHAELDESSKRAECLLLLTTFIESLLTSPVLDYQRAGEILYHFGYMMHHAARLHETNRMTARVLAMILVPVLTDVLSLFSGKDDMIGLAQFMEQFTPGLTAFISDARNSQHFSERYADMMPHLAKTRSDMVAKLNQMKQKTSGIYTTPIQNKMMRASLLQSQIASLTDELSNPKIHRKSKKKLKKQIHKLQEERTRLDLKINVLIEKIALMNQQQKQLTSDIRVLSSSGEAISEASSSQPDSSLPLLEASVSSVSFETNFFGFFSRLPSEDAEIRQAIHDLEQYYPNEKPPAI